MATHFWLSAESVPLTLEQIAGLTDEQARLFLAELRWGSREQQVCPDCGAIDHHYNIRTRKQWRCKHCFRTFSVTSGTPFADQKVGYRKLAMAIFAFVIGHKGLAALALRRIIGGQYRTSFTLLHKVREAVMATVRTDKLSGVIEVDGGHFSGRPRKGRKLKKSTPTDKKEVPAKYSQHRTKTKASSFPHHPNRRIVMVIRESLCIKGQGAGRTVVAICRSENGADIEALMRQWVEKQSTIRSDELPGYRKLKLMGYIHEVVNHSEEFSSKDGFNQNQAESFFSRMRRACIGVYHRITPKYMLDYATEMAWREEVRRLNTKQQMAALMGRVLSAGVSTDWFNYGRGNKRAGEILFQAPVTV